MPQMPEKNSHVEVGQVTDRASAAGAVVLEILARAADDRKFLAWLDENPWESPRKELGR